MIVAGEHFAANVTVPDERWEDTEDGRLLASMIVCGVPMFLEAYEIVEHEDGSWDGAHERGSDLDAIWNAVGGDKRWYWFERGGKKYALVATPYCD